MYRCFPLLVASLALTACGTSKELCCELELREDITSDVTIVRGRGKVIFANVSAVADFEDKYLVEIRPFDSNAPKLKYLDCSYFSIDKQSGKTQKLSYQDRSMEPFMKFDESHDFIVQTGNSCLAEKEN